MSCDVYPDKKDVAKQLKLCPFRKKTYVMASSSDYSFNTYLTELFEEDFLPCLKERCAVWNKHYEQCGLTNKFN